MSKLASIVFLPVLTIASINCASTTQSARYSRAPVLLGPVPCVGCAPRQFRPRGEPSFTDYSKVASWSFSTVLTTTHGVTVVPSKLNEKSAIITDPCHSELVLRELGASAVGLFPLFVLYDSSSTNVAGDVVNIPSGSCDLSIERWPLSGPRGISWPPAAGPPPASPALPPPAPAQPGLLPPHSNGGVR
jgi:hypothetical protein